MKGFESACFGSTHTLIGVMLRLAWPLCKYDMKTHEAFNAFYVFLPQFKKF